MKKILSAVIFAMMILIANSQANATDVYAGNYKGYEIYVDSLVAGFRSGGQMQVFAKLVSGGKKTHSIMGKFILNKFSGTWFGNLFINGGMMSLVDYPVESEPLTYAIFTTAYKYLP